MTTNLLNKYRPHSPAIIALLIQLASLCLIAVSLSLAWRLFHFKLALNQVLLVQAILTLLLTRYLGLAWWWCVIQPVFPFGVVLMLMLPLPPYLYLLLFLFLLAFYWSTYRTQVPYFPSTRAVWLAVETLLPPDRPCTMIDIGSGLGGLVLFLSGRHSVSSFVGVEIAPLPWLVSYLRSRWLGRAQFLRKDYESMNFADFDIVFAYLSPAAMPALWNKARREMRPGSQLISYEFPIPEVPANLSISPDGNQPVGLHDARVLHVWTM